MRRFNVFSQRPVERPAGGILALHPLVDVLEGRRFLSATVHAGVFTVVGEGGFAEIAEADVDVTVIDRDAAGKREVVEGELVEDDDGAPAVVVIDGEAGPFCAATIGDTDEVLFGNLFHDRRGQFVAPALPSPEDVEQARFIAEDGGDDAAAFATRPLTGTLRPYLMMQAESEDGGHPFAG